jgi:hypothetical protein
LQVIYSICMCCWNGAYLVKRKEALSYNFTFRYEDDVL